MISKTDFATINSEIIKTIDDTLIELRIANQNDYALFLADGEYRKEQENTRLKLNPNVIDYRIDRYKDASRLTFLSEFLSTFYSFPSSQKSIDDSEQRMHMELMVYTHIWEAKPFLKKLYRLAQLNNDEQYIWDVQIPDMSNMDLLETKSEKALVKRVTTFFKL